jgi:hypothetical protein
MNYIDLGATEKRDEIEADCRIPCLSASKWQTVGHDIMSVGYAQKI